MARYKRFRRRASAARSYAGRGRSFGKGGSGLMGNVIDGAMVGVIQGIVPDDMFFGMVDPLAMIGVGWFRKNQTLQTLGGYQLGLKATQFFGGGRTATGGSGGLY